MSLLYSLLVGAIAGWLAGKIMKGGGFGLLLNIVIGIFGGLVGNWLFSVLGISISDGIIGDIVTGAIGASVILFVAGLFKK
ncbi:GlsB/YeaQ/YmgE family stress response membrane protein [Tamlana flava]|uniref:GlsB/YeaQ/YmgE family stress response membrane protein n=1 Tax=Tamlana flava TaxID=3158572 RepID=UPI00351B6D18